MNWFSKKKTNNTQKTANTVVNLRENIATQEKREAHLEKKIEQLVGEAKEKMAKKDKKGELLLLMFLCGFVFGWCRQVLFILGRRALKFRVQKTKYV